MRSNLSSKESRLTAFLQLRTNGNVIARSRPKLMMERRKVPGQTLESSDGFLQDGYAEQYSFCVTVYNANIISCSLKFSSNDYDLRHRPIPQTLWNQNGFDVPGLSSSSVQDAACSANTGLTRVRCCGIPSLRNMFHDALGFS